MRGNQSRAWSKAMTWGLPSRIIKYPASPHKVIDKATGPRHRLSSKFSVSEIHIQIRHLQGRRWPFGAPRYQEISLYGNIVMSYWFQANLKKGKELAACPIHQSDSSEIREGVNARWRLYCERAGNSIHHELVNTEAAVKWPWNAISNPWASADKQIFIHIQ